MMDSDLGLSFFKSQIFVRGGTPVQFFFKKLYFDLPIPKRGLPGPHCLPFWSYGAPKFCKIWANPTHSLWRTTFCKMKAVRNYVWKNLTHSLWTRNISILTLRKFFRFSLTHTQTCIHTHTHTHTHKHTHTHTHIMNQINTE